jgi:hypothetical protein
MLHAGRSLDGQHRVALALRAPEEAKTNLYSWIDKRWDESAVRYLKRYL